MPKERRAEANQYPMPEALQHIPEWATTAKVRAVLWPEQVDFLDVRRLPGCWKTAVEGRDWALENGATEQEASVLMFEILEFLD